MSKLVNVTSHILRIFIFICIIQLSECKWIPPCQKVVKMKNIDMDYLPTNKAREECICPTTNIEAESLHTEHNVEKTQEILVDQLNSKASAKNKRSISTRDLVFYNQDNNRGFIDHKEEDLASNEYSKESSDEKPNSIENKENIKAMIMLYDSSGNFNVQNMSHLFLNANNGSVIANSKNVIDLLASPSVVQTSLIQKPYSVFYSEMNGFNRKLEENLIDMQQSLISQLLVLVSNLTRELVSLSKETGATFNTTNLNIPGVTKLLISSAQVFPSYLNSS